MFSVFAVVLIAEILSLASSYDDALSHTAWCEGFGSRGLCPWELITVCGRDAKVDLVKIPNPTELQVVKAPRRPLRCRSGGTLRMFPVSCCPS